MSKIKDGAYIRNLDEYESIGTPPIVLYVNAENVRYFDSFGVEHIPKKIRKIIGNKLNKIKLYIFKKTLNLSIVYSVCDHNYLY